MRIVSEHNRLLEFCMLEAPGFDTGTLGQAVSPHSAAASSGTQVSEVTSAEVQSQKNFSFSHCDAFEQPCCG